MKMNKQIATTTIFSILICISVGMLIKNEFASFPAGIISWQVGLMMAGTLATVIVSLLTYFLVYRNKKSVGRQKALMFGSIYSFMVLATSFGLNYLIYSAGIFTNFYAITVINVAIPIILAVAAGLSKMPTQR